MDGIFRGVTPELAQLRIEDLTGGCHQVRFSKQGFSDFTYSMIVTPGTVRYYSEPLHTEQLPQTGSIALSSNPSPASIFIDDSYCGETSASGYTIVPMVLVGVHQMKLTKSGYLDDSFEAVVQPGGTTWYSRSLS